MSFDEVAENYFNNEVINTDFFEIFFFKKGAGTLILNHEKIAITDHSIVFISPFQKQKWELDLDGLDFTLLIFQEEFLNDFPSDKLFIYSLLYFYQLAFPVNMQGEEERIERYCILLSEIKTELSKTKADSVHIIRSLIYYLLQKLNREYAEKHQLSIEKQDSNYVFQFKKLVETHIGKKQRIND